MGQNALIAAVKKAATEKLNPAGEKYLSLIVADSERLAGDCRVPIRQVERTALEAEITPERYQRSIGTVGLRGQIKLLEATVGVFGAGGLGGFVLELLARMGVGRLVVVDGDVFSDSNLNRQLLATERTLGMPKVKAAAERIKAVNNTIGVETHHCRGDAGNLPGIFGQCDLVIDCLDNLPSRYELEKVCQKLNITLIHGAIGGFLGQLAVIRPGRPLISAIYGSDAGDGSVKGVEVQLGNPATTPAMLAAWQANEAIKILAGLDGVLPADRLLIIDMQAGETYKIELASE